MTSHQLIGLLSVIVGFAGYIPYLYDMFRGRTKPHIFSWIIWVVLEFTSFGIQIKNGVGAGSWVTFFSALVAVIVVLYAFRYRKLTITKIDWVCLFGACFSLVLWLVFHQPLIASIFLSLTDLFAFIPTFRKTWNKPYDETLFEYAMASVKFMIAFFAFDSFTLSAVIYPAYLILTNGTFVIYALIRRKIVNRS
jgi:hypothetical protein